MVPTATAEALGRGESAAQVGEQILCYPNAVRVPANGVELYIVRNFRRSTNAPRSPRLSTQSRSTASRFR
jgi:hypothetical protein